MHIRDAAPLGSDRRSRREQTPEQDRGTKTAGAKGTVLGTVVGPGRVGRTNVSWLLTIPIFLL